MGSNLDIIMSVVLAGMLITMVFFMQLSISETRNETLILSRMQSNISIMKDILKQEIKKIGNGLTNKEDLFMTIDPQEIRFQLELNNNLLADNVSIFKRDYTTDPTPENSDDFQIVKRTTFDDGTQKEEVLSMVGITDLSFEYFDKNMGIPVTNEEIRFVKIFLEIQSTEKINDQFLKSQIKETLFLRNIYKF